jgi:hypothetical protein
MSKNLVLDVVMRELALYGIKPKIEQSKHLKVTWITPKGEHRTVTVPCTPSEGKRSHLNNRAWVRRLMRQDGMVPSNH